MMFRLLIVFVICPAFAVSQTITVSGETPTGVVFDGGGKATISIAPTSGTGVSLNKYGQFSVGVAGVDLDNRSVGATTIVNEVTGSTRSTINGDITVLGGTADVIIANPNGISVSGGKFVNARNVTLITGASQTGTDGLGYSITGGDIEIGPGGLSGQMQRLDLAAREIRLNGNVDGQSLNFFAGEGTALIAADGLEIAPTNGAGVLFQLNSSAFINGSSISVLVNGNGAGTYLAGGLASAGEFQVTSTGQIVLDNLQAETAGHIRIAGAEVTGSGEIASTTGSVTMRATEGSIDLAQFSILGIERDFSDFASRGSITLIAEENAILNDGVMAFGADDLSVVALHDFVLRDVNLTGDGSFSAEVGQDTDFAGVSARIGGSVLVSSLGVLRFSGDIETERSISITAHSVALDGSTTQSRLASTNAGIFVQATQGDILNHGTSVQTAGLFTGSDVSGVGLEFRAAGNIHNISSDADQLSVLFAATGTMVLDAGADIINRTGRILANFDLSLIAGGKVGNETQSEGGNGLVVRRYRGARSLKSLFLKRTDIVEVTASHGSLLGDGEQAYIQSAAGNLNIAATGFHNLGGLVSGRDVNVVTTGSFRNEAQLTGTLKFKQECYLFHCVSSGGGFVLPVGGSITGSQNLNIDVGGAMTMKGGSLVSGLETVIDAGNVDIQGLDIPQLVKRPGTLGDFFQAQIGWLRFGSASAQLASFGSLEIKSLGEVTLRQVDLQVEEELVVPVEINRVNDVGGVHIGRRPKGGLFSNILN